MKHYKGITKWTPCDFALVCCCPLGSNRTDRCHVVLHIKLGIHTALWKYQISIAWPSIFLCCCHFIYNIGNSIWQFCCILHHNLFKYKLHLSYIKSLACKKETMLTSQPLVYMLVVFNQQLAGDWKMKLISTSFPLLPNFHGQDSQVNH